MNYLYASLGLLFLLIPPVYPASKKAFVAVPVVDLVGNRCKNYNSFPLESKKESFLCPRIHQLLFNEVVQILETTKTEAKVKISNLFYVTKKNPKNPQDTYWTQKKNLILFDQLKKKGLQLKYIPEPIQYSSPNMYQVNKNTITIKFPFYDPITKQLFSAGTRFIKTDTGATENYTVFVFDKKSFTFKKTNIPTHICFSNEPKSNAQKRDDFVTMVKQWANLQKGFIPYVWGGCSFTRSCQKNNIVTITCKDKKQDKMVPIFIRPDYTKSPMTGLDCSGIIARAAQLCNIPYFYKNTTTAEQYLKKLKDLKTVENGDLLFYSGHIMIVSDKKNNKVVEARTNGYGCGKVQEIPLCKVFKEIESYDDLCTLKKNKKPLYRLDKNGNIVKSIKSFDFLKLIP